MENSSEGQKNGSMGLLINRIENLKTDKKMRNYEFGEHICPPYSITLWKSKGDKIVYDNFG